MAKVNNLRVACLVSPWIHVSTLFISLLPVIIFQGRKAILNFRDPIPLGYGSLWMYEFLYFCLLHVVFTICDGIYLLRAELTLIILLHFLLSWDEGNLQALSCCAG
ncbi:hypothetical protein EV426DRAFT_616782 [Tirmania nivea]|nr:hypothetical protein EV426DRAFT_616782 [Tirmania nivea]